MLNNAGPSQPTAVLFFARDIVFCDMSGNDAIGTGLAAPQASAIEGLCRSSSNWRHGQGGKAAFHLAIRGFQDDRRTGNRAWRTSDRPDSPGRRIDALRPHFAHM